MDFFVVDAFTDRPFGGNPAAVVLLSEPRDDAWLQAVAAEFNLSETAFVDLTGDHHDASLPLRWFTPATEVDLCGHGTLASAHVLGGERAFATRSGELRCRPGRDGSITMDFPADRPAPVQPPDVLASALPGVTIERVLRGRDDLLVQAASAAQVRAARPNLAAIATLPVRGVVVTAPGDALAEDPDFVSRCFYPSAGIAEDPVTGSAHCLLCCHWSAELGRNELIGLQLSGRGGRVAVFDDGDRVRLAGRAVTVLRGTFAV